MGEQEIHNVLELVKHNELQNLQWKVEYLRNEINMLEWEKTNATNHLLVLNRRIDEFQGTLNRYEYAAQKRGQMGYINQESGWCDNNDNMYATYAEPNSYSIQLSYGDYWP
jgi:hypothetical protein